MNISPITIDIFAVLILILAALHGRRKGLIKTLSGIIALVLAFSLSGFLANETAPIISQKYVAPHILSAVTPEVENPSDSDVASDLNSLSDMFLKLGIPESVVNGAYSDFTDTMNESIVEPIIAISNSIAYKITYPILFLIYFLILLVILSLLLKMLNLAAKLPGLNFANKTFGLILGVIMGYLIVMSVSFVLLKSGTILTNELVNDTTVLSFIMNVSPASLI